MEKKKLEHVAIIMDGNGRWAKSRHLPRVMGHHAGVRAVERTVRAAKDLGIPYISLYAFSTENWKRPKGEVLGLMELPIAGLMNALDAPAMSEKVHHLEKTWAEIGCTMPSPFMTMALIPLACLPELRLTNRGLVDCTTFQFVDLVVDEG